MSQILAELQIGDELFWEPVRLVPPESWVGHIPFAFWLVKALRPEMFVELGTHSGNSFSAFCQAIAALRLPGRAFAVDTWKGDEHSGKYDEEVFEDIASFNKAHYLGFATLLRTTFDDARQYFAEGSIDLLHIDGLHTYEAVTHDFDNWRNALTPRAVVVLHDINVRERDFAVWKLWQELSRQYPSFQFDHSNGLGVLGVGQEQVPLLQRLFEIGRDQKGAFEVRRWFSSRGISFQRLAQSSAREVEAHRLRALVADLEGKLLSRSDEIDRLRREASTHQRDLRALVADLEGKLLSRNDEIDRLHREASTHQRETHKLRTDIETRNGEIVSLASTVAAYEGEIGFLKNQISALHNSTSWRITGPLRSVVLGARRGVSVVRRSGLGNECSQSAGGQAVPLQSGLFNEEGALRTETLSSEICPPLLVPFDHLERIGIPPIRIGVMIHAFYPDLLPEIVAYLGNMPVPADLFVTTDTEAKRAEIAIALKGWKNGEVRSVIYPNRGRDIAAKVYGLAKAHNTYDLVLHLHTKKSPHSEYGENWRTYLLETLIGSEEIVRSVLAAFSRQPRLGIVAADNWAPISGCLNWGYDYPIARDLAARMGIRISREEPLEFHAGSMFWARPAALEPLLSLRLQPEDFPEETGQTDGTLAHAIERLFLRTCEHARFSWVRIARASALTNENRNQVRIASVDELDRALGMHPLLLSDPMLCASGRLISDRPQDWPVRVAPEFNPRPRLNLLLPTFRSSSVFGGIATAYALFEKVAAHMGEDIDLRMVFTADYERVQSSDLPPGWTLAAPEQQVETRSAVCIPCGLRTKMSLTVRENDIFFVSAWWDAAAAFGLIDLQKSFFGRRHRLRYFIQDYEPNFSAWSSPWSIAEGTYRRPRDTVAMINSNVLAEYLNRLGYEFEERYVFQPLWNDGLGAPSLHRDALEEDILLVYWRPHVERNLGSIVKAGLASWLEQDPYGADRWRIFAIGEDGPDVRLTDWRSMENLGKLELAQYAALLRRAKVGLSLMLSPHPSYPPLEMAAFGMRVITNRFGTKDLSTYGDAIECVTELTPAAVADALLHATAVDGRATGETLHFDVNAAFANEIDLESLAAGVADGIRSDLMR
jgi:hypothetical protein